MGTVFYSDFNSRIDFLQNEIKDYIMSRDLEKQDLITAVQSGSNYTSNINLNCKNYF
jgi:DNA replication initiation complex subunit (GINS family)